jgi:zinc and cadmium transporter
VLGGIAGYFFLSRIEGILPYLLPIAAGGFVYIAASDLMPEIRKEANIKKSVTAFAIFVLGILLMYLVKFISH